jgi:uncharacterized protein YecE (DUF72 family)
MWNRGPYVGTSGFSYKSFVGPLYPPGLPQTRWLDHYVTAFNTVELNNTFYNMPKPATVQSWRERAPEGFLYAIKVSRYLTHIRRLRDVAEPLDRVYRLMEGLGPRLGPLLFQLPPTMPRNDVLLDSFLPELSSNFVHVLEFRHLSWFAPEVIERLDRTGISIASVSSPKIKTPVVAAGRLIYLRFHGEERMFASSYSETELARWSQEALALLRKRKMSRRASLFAYFNNDAEGHAVPNARILAAQLGSKPPRRARAPRLL